MADPNQTPKRGEWQCPCNGCKLSRKKALREILDLYDQHGGDAYHQRHMILKYIKEELEKK